VPSNPCAPPAAYSAQWRDAGFAASPLPIPAPDPASVRPWRQVRDSAGAVLHSRQAVLTPQKKCRPDEGAAPTCLSWPSPRKSRGRSAVLVDLLDQFLQHLLGLIVGDLAGARGLMAAAA